MTCYPLLFEPILKERLWGGTKLKNVFGKPSDSSTIGESWEVSTVKGDVSQVANGPYRGKDLNQLIEAHGAALLGREVVSRFGAVFPILIKFIDAHKDLSIQLHPNDALAKERHDSFGKTEMWYVMDADKDASLIVGFNQDMTPEGYQEHMDKDTLLTILNRESVAKGDTFFINTGKVHAIGAGVLLAEIQQTSDVTYRIYDYNRKDKNGQLRELHTQLALDAIDYKKKDDFRVVYDTKTNVENPMVDSPYFKTTYLRLADGLTLSLPHERSFTILMCVDGSATIATANGKESIRKGQTVLVPACAQTIGIDTQDAELLKVSL